MRTTLAIDDDVLLAARDRAAPQTDDRPGRFGTGASFAAPASRLDRAKRCTAAAGAPARRRRYARHRQYAARRVRVTFLLDVNLLIALIDPTHVGHDRSHRWFAATGAASWATCPLTENGVIRIVGHPRYPNSTGSPTAAAPIVAGLPALPGHVFWPDDLSLAGSDFVDVARIATPGQVLPIPIS
jgi:uncharacterized protein